MIANNLSLSVCTEWPSRVPSKEIFELREKYASRTPEQDSEMEKRIAERAELDHHMDTHGKIFTKDEYESQLEIAKKIVAEKKEALRLIGDDENYFLKNKED